MKNYLIAILLAIMLGLSIVQVTYSGECVKIANSVYNKGVSWGNQMRLVTGWDDNGNRHRWAERYEKGKWRLWDMAIWMVGKSWYTAEETGYNTLRIIKEN